MIVNTFPGASFVHIFVSTSYFDFILSLVYEHATTCIMYNVLFLCSPGAVSAYLPEGEKD